jgi:molecular chaperone DnaK
MKISGSHLRRPIPQGAEIRLTMHIDESRRISVDALVPHSNESFSDGIYMPEEEQPDPREQLRKLPSAITPLIERLDAIERATDDPDVIEEVIRVRGVLEEADLEGSGMEARPDDPDFADRVVQRVNDTRVDIASLEKKTGSGAVSAFGFERVKRQAGAAREVVEKCGADSDKSELVKIMRELERAESRGDSRSARKLGEQLQSLRWRVLFNQDWFWKDAFEALKQPGQKFVNQQAARKWLDAGELAIRKGDSISLRESVNNLWGAQSKSDVAIAKERAEHSGLCRY